MTNRPQNETLFTPKNSSKRRKPFPKKQSANHQPFLRLRATRSSFWPNPFSKDRNAMTSRSDLVNSKMMMTKNRSARTASTSSNYSSEEAEAFVSVHDIVVVLSEDDYDDASSFCSSVSGSIDISGHTASDRNHHSLPLPGPPLSTPPPPLATPPPLVANPSPRRKARSCPVKGSKMSQQARQLSPSTTTSDYSCVSESRWDCSSTKDYMPTVSPGIHRKRPATICSPKGLKSRDVPILTSFLMASRNRSLALSHRPPSSTKEQGYVEDFMNSNKMLSGSFRCSGNPNTDDDVDEITLAPLSGVSPSKHNSPSTAHYVDQALSIVKSSQRQHHRGTPASSSSSRRRQGRRIVA